MTAETTFDATQDTLEALLREIGTGKLQLPDFQRGWVWDDEHIRSVATSVFRSFPIGAIMTLMTGGNLRFQPRAVEGVAFPGPAPTPERLVLDGQQRLTSLHQALTLPRPICTRNDKGREVKLWYYVNIAKALGSADEREQAIFSISDKRQFTEDFGRKIVLDLSTQEQEYANSCFPLYLTFASDHWFTGWMKHWNYDPAKIELFNRFRTEFIDTFKTYPIPVIQLRRTASKEAVCRVFEKVNTGGVPLTAFELLTATYAVDGYKLRQDWYGDNRSSQTEPGRAARLAKAGPVLKAVENTDFLQVVSLLYTLAKRQHATDGPPPAISCTRQAILDIPLEAYRIHGDPAEEGLRRARQFLWREKVFSDRDLPYRTQLVPLAAILVTLDGRWNDDPVRRRVRQWYWCRVLGELYGGAIESRFARDLPEVVAWALNEGGTPQTVLDCNIVTDRLLTLRSRLSAAYKGLHALVMQRGGVQDWRTGAGVDEQNYFGEQIDIHHIFPRAWCEQRGIGRGLYNSIINKTALSAVTNQFLGGDAPSVYLRRLQEKQKLPPDRIDEFLRIPLHRRDRITRRRLVGNAVGAGSSACRGDI